ncbi:hypothetical protein LX73_1536 [Fodinibius salinus]|uniref:Uncharacterized protein n=1 Tax=Fodinibius salinus TaxID=860790 RepID=A0A5D3YJ76_9BACT|nr:hypothetical protein [Fodinibius salinus]TYP93823.1 hypothetical protein LX73_1536 [Fodinibius salinus]
MRRLSRVFAGVVFGILLLSASATVAQEMQVSSKQQVAAAVSAAPDEMQSGTAVLGYKDSGKLIQLREGSNKLICIADKPGDDEFHVACYHKDLEPFMKRGRELRAQGLSTAKVDSLRRAEVKAGKLELPRKAMALYSLTASKGSYDYETGTITNASPLYVIYVPFATSTTTGLSEKPASKGAPWIMEPGKPWAHIMVVTGRNVSSSTDDENK